MLVERKKLYLSLCTVHTYDLSDYDPNISSDSCDGGVGPRGGGGRCGLSQICSENYVPPVFGPSWDRKLVILSGPQINLQPAFDYFSLLWLTGLDYTGSAWIFLLE